MGGLGHHHTHPYLLQAASLFVAMLFPAGAIALALGARFERLRRHHGRA
jgi:ABC-type Na+ efflux pump permease subunit